MTPVDAALAVAVAAVIIVLMSLLPEPARQRFNAIFVAGAGAAYLDGGLGGWEFAFTAVATYVAYRGLESYRFIALGWILHTLWDVVHHLRGQPIVFFMPTSSGQCAITDALLAVWFFVGAPSALALIRGRTRPPATRSSPSRPPRDPSSGRDRTSGPARGARSTG